MKKILIHTRHPPSFVFLSSRVVFIWVIGYLGFLGHSHMVEVFNVDNMYEFQKFVCNGTKRPNSSSLLA